MTGWHFWVDRGGRLRTLWRAPPPARSPPKNSCRKTPSATRTPPWPASRNSSACLPALPSRPASSRTSKWAPPSPPTRCWSARAPPRCCWSTTASPTSCASATRPAPACSISISNSPACSTPGSRKSRPRRGGRHPHRGAGRTAALQTLRDAQASGIRSVAIALIHAWKFPELEQRLGELAAQTGFTNISLSHIASPLLRLVPRGDTTMADAYLSPILKHYVAQVSAGLNHSPSTSCNPTAASPARKIFREGRDPLRPRRRHRRHGRTPPPRAFPPSLGLTWAAPALTPPSTTTPSNTHLRPKSPACACAPPCSPSIPSPRAAAPSSVSTVPACAPGRKVRAPTPAPPPTAKAAAHHHRRQYSGPQNPPAPFPRHLWPQRR